MVKKDNIILGILVGLVLPVLAYGVLSLAALLPEPGTIWARPFEAPRMAILSLAFNVIPLRLYFVTYKFEKSGRGVLLITFVLMAVYFLTLRYF
jgi:hypothetical protein